MARFTEASSHSSQSAASVPANPEPVAEQHPTTEEIAARAYEIYVQRGEAHGSDVEDWLQAEQELTEKYSTTQRAKATTA